MVVEECYLHGQHLEMFECHDCKFAILNNMRHECTKNDQASPFCPYLFLEEKAETVHSNLEVWFLAIEKLFFNQCNIGSLISYFVYSFFVKLTLFRFIYRH